MTDLTGIMYAGMAVWLGLGLYLFFLMRRQTALARRMERMSQLAGDDRSKP